MTPGPDDECSRFKRTGAGSIVAFAPDLMSDKKPFAGAVRFVVPALGAALAVAGGIAAAWHLRGVHVPQREAAAVERPVREAPQPVWSRVSDPEPLFGLAAGRYPQPVRHEVLRLSDGVTRMDVFTFGGLQGGPFARLVLERVTEASPAESGLFVSVARTAAAEGHAIERASVPAMKESRFGAMETAEVRLVSERGPVACTVFRGTAAEGPLRWSGWACGEADTASAARCLVDAARFSPEIHEPAMARVFEESEERIAAPCRAEPAPAEPDVTASVRPAAKKQRKH